MRSTGPSLRRRNHAWLEAAKKNNRWLERRDDSDTDGFASGEDSDGIDSDDDDDARLQLRPQLPAARPAVTNALRPTAGLGLGLVRPTQTARPTAVVAAPVPAIPSRAASPPVVALPVAPPAAARPVATSAAASRPAAALPTALVPSVVLGAEEDDDSITDGIESGVESASGDELSDDEAPPGRVLAPPPVATAAPVATALPVAAQPVGEVQQPPPAQAPPAQAPPAATKSTAVAAPVATLAPGAPAFLAPVASDVAADPPATATSAGLETVVTGTTTEAAAETPTEAATESPTALTSSEGAIDIPTLIVSELLPLPTSDASPGSGAVQVAPNDTLGSITSEESPNTGAAVGIVIGTLAAVGLLIVAAYMWKRRRGDKPFPQLPFFRKSSQSDDSVVFNQEKKDYDNMNDTIPILPPPSEGSKKTNSEMLDTLMQATYKAESGMDRPEQPSDSDTFGRPANFMDERAYTALAGPPTPAADGRKPVIQWLDNTKTPRQSEVPPSARWPNNAPAGPPPQMPPMPAAWKQDPTPRNAPMLQPPQPAFRNDNRNTAATTTTTTSASSAWFG